MLPGWQERTNITLIKTKRKNYTFILLAKGQLQIKVIKMLIYSQCYQRQQQ